jgi:XTP/dITP diphosphohydrolase
MRKLVIASFNNHKVNEIKVIISELLGKNLTDEIVSAADLELKDVKETGVTLAENSLLKAKSVFDQLDKKFAVLSDDSGLFVDIFGNAPGILSARWAGKHGDDTANRRLVLDQLEDIDDPNRTAYFATSCTLIIPSLGPSSATDVGESEQVIQVEGRNSGKILKTEIGQNGFGYDSIFESSVYPNRSFAEVTAEEKDRVSHRARAVEKLAQELGELFR